MRIQLLNKSINPITRDTLTTFLINDFPKALLAELNTHKLMASNAESSRARPVFKVIQQITDDPYIPPFTYNRPGMSGEYVTQEDYEQAELIWKESIEFAMQQAQRLANLGIHKQDTNRLLDPFIRVSVIATMGGLGWNNFFNLRNHPAAQPTFQDFAATMERMYHSFSPVELQIGEWHKPWSDDSIEVNTARAAGISYANHNRHVTEEDRIRVHDDLIKSRPIHGSPLEHCAMAIVPGGMISIDGVEYRVFDHFNPDDTLTNITCWRSGHFISVAKFGGFCQYRKIVELGGSVADSFIC